MGIQINKIGLHEQKKRSCMNQRLNAMAKTIIQEMNYHCDRFAEKTRSIP